MVDERDALLRQIDEEVRRERYLKLWNQYGVYVLGAVAAIVLGIGGWKWYEHEQRTAAARAGAQFAEITQLLGEGKKEDAIRGFEQIVKDGPTGYTQLAQLRLAADARQNGKKDEALKYYETLANDSSADELLRGFANLQIAALKVDTASWTETQNRLTDLVKDDSSWKYSARELLGLAAYKAGQYGEARKTFTELIAGADTPGSIRQRAQMVMTLITQKEAASSSPSTPAKTAGQDGKDKKGADKSGDAKTQ